MSTRDIVHHGRFLAFVSRQGETAMIRIYDKKAWYENTSVTPLEEYETMSSGASASARKQIKKMIRERK
jgi:hypothetical protein